MDAVVKKEVTVIDAIDGLIRSVRYLFSKWLVILLAGLVFGILGITYAWMQKPTYIAEMSFTTEAEGGSKLSAYAGLAAQFGFDLAGGTNNIFEGDNLVELFKSRNLIEKTLLTPSGASGRLMIDDYIISNKIKINEKYQPVEFGPDVTTNTRYEDSLLAEIYSTITTDQLKVFRKDKKLSIIILRMESVDETFSKNFVEILARNAIQFYTDYKSRKSRQNVEILQKQADSVRSMLFGGMAAVAAISDLNVNPLRQSMRTPVQRRQVDVQANGVLYGELLKNLELSKLSLRRETPLIQVIDTPRYPLEVKKMGRLKAAVIFAFLGGIAAVTFLLIRRFMNNSSHRFNHGHK